MKRAVKALVDSRILGRALIVGVLFEVLLMLAGISGRCCTSITPCSAA